MMQSKKDATIKEVLEEMLKLANEDKLIFLHLTGLIEEDTETTGCCEFTGAARDEIPTEKIMLAYISLSTKLQTMRKMIKEACGIDPESAHKFKLRKEVEQKLDGKHLH